MTSPTPMLIVEECVGGYVAAYVPDPYVNYPERIEWFSTCPLTAAADAMAGAAHTERGEDGNEAKEGA